MARRRGVFGCKICKVTNFQIMSTMNIFAGSTEAFVEKQASAHGYWHHGNVRELIRGSGSSASASLIEGALVWSDGTGECAVF